MTTDRIAIQAHKFRDEAYEDSLLQIDRPPDAGSVPALRPRADRVQRLHEPHRGSAGRADPRQRVPHRRRSARRRRVGLREDAQQHVGGVQPQRSLVGRDHRPDPRPGLVRQRTLARDLQAQLDGQQRLRARGHERRLEQPVQRRRAREPDDRRDHEGGRPHGADDDRRAAHAARVVLLPADGLLRRRAAGDEHEGGGDGTRAARFDLPVHRVRAQGDAHASCRQPAPPARQGV